VHRLQEEVRLSQRGTPEPQGPVRGLEGENKELASRVAQDQQTIDELKRQIDELNKTPPTRLGSGRL